MEFLKGHDDFRLEIACLEALKSHGFAVGHGGTYEDPITKKSRQFDLRASITHGFFKVRLAVECKSLSDFFPLVVSRLPRLPDESFHEIIYSFTRDNELHLIGSPTAKAIRLSMNDSVYKPSEPVGKSTSQVGRSEKGDLITGDAEVFEKWAQAIASAYDLISDSGRDNEIEKKDFFVSLTLPILVIPDGTLWVADYSADGTLTGRPQQMDTCEIFVGKDVWPGPMSVGYSISHLHVFTKTKFFGFLNRLHVNLKFWEVLFPSEVILARINNQED